RWEWDAVERVPTAVTESASADFVLGLFGGAPGAQVGFARDAQGGGGFAARFAGQESDPPRRDGGMVIGCADQTDYLRDVRAFASGAVVGKNAALGVEFGLAGAAEIAVGVGIERLVNAALAAAEEQGEEEAEGGQAGVHGPIFPSSMDHSRIFR